MYRIDIQLEFAGAYGRGVLRGIMEYANIRADWGFIMPPLYSNAPRGELPPADGVLGMLHSPEAADRYRAAGIPVVNTARTLPVEELRRLSMPSVLPDDAAVGKIAFDYFLERRFRTYAFCGHPTAAWSQMRLAAFAAECQREGLFFASTTFVDQAPSRQWLLSLPRPCALLAANDRYAWQVIDACRDNDISVPQDIAVLGVDNDVFLTQMVRPTLSSVDLGSERIGFEAARILDGMLKGRTESNELIELQPGGVITRHSTDVLSIEDESVAEAVQFIREHAAEQISVEDVLRQVAMSRRNLERRFRQVMRRSLLDEIRRVHLERAARLLRDTSLDIPGVAEQSGFASHVRFSTVFREHIGMTPSAYRRNHRTGSG